MASKNIAQTSFYGQYDQLPQTWNTVEDLQLSPEIFIDFESSVFDDETTSNASTLHNASKKINKASPVAKKSSSNKRSKRARNPWSPREDAQLMELMKKYGQSWAMISSVMEGRTGKQVRDRYLNKLRPNIKCGDWSAEEDEKLVALCKEVGNRWSLIATHLPGRTEGQVKNRYYSYIKKRLLPNGTLSQTSESRNVSETATSSASSPIGETTFDYTQEYDFSNLSQMNFVPQEKASTLMVSKGPYFTEEMVSEQSTTQSTPFRVPMIDAADVISYDMPDEVFFARAQSGIFALPPIQHDSQIDEMLHNVTNYFQSPSNAGASSDVDSFFAEDLRTDERNFYAFPTDDSDRFMQLSQRKAYLELALANTLKEIKGL